MVAVEGAVVRPVRLTVELVRLVRFRSAPQIPAYIQSQLACASSCWKARCMARTRTAGDPSAAPNLSLRGLLDQVGWRPEALARRVNAVLEQPPWKRRIHEKTPYKWLRGEVPHPPIPDIVVDLLGQAIGHPVAHDEVWPTTVRNGRPQPWRVEDLDVPWDHTGLLQLLGAWPGMLTRRTFLALSGAALTDPAWQWLDAPVPVPARGGTSTQVPPPLLPIIDGMVAGAQQLDDKHGSAAADFVAGQFATVARIVRRSTYDAETGRRLCAALAQLAQTSGWMAQEAAQDGLAQRWYHLGLRNAHSAGDRSLAASIMALMSNHATALGRHRDALQLAAAAGEAASQTPAAVQALIAARSALAHAGAGDLTGVERARARAAELINDADERPTWARYVTATEVDAIAGRALVMLARHVPGRRQGSLIRDAETLLRERALDPAEDHRRSALRHGAWLSLAYVRAGDLDLAVQIGCVALDRLPMVTSARCLMLLADLRADLAPHARRSHKVHNLVNSLDAHVPRPPSATRAT
ncbi:hypothetical protein AB0M95_22545 [Sphaerisporangium sp. NPDC051017]|uniref:hypothetical protein n=1 Tax=Sphaerisporangium sp. NPDC051017 TaxID=3154636 RepID=UPI00342544D1